MTPTRDLVFPEAVERPADLFGRAALLQQIQEALPRRTVVILGGRLLGKTSMLNVVTQWAEATGRFAAVRLAPTDTHQRFLTEITRGIQKCVAERAPTVGASVGNAPAVATGTGLVGRIHQLAAQAPGVTFLLCIDELDSLIQGCSDEEAQRILNLIVHLTSTQPRLPIRFLLTMMRVPDRIRRSYASPILSKSAIVEIRPWHVEPAREFVDWLLGGRLVLDRDAHDILYQATGGHPYFTKAVLKALLGATRTSPPAGPLSAAVRTAMAVAAHSRDVTEFLRNMLEVHLPRNSAVVLDRAGASSVGVTTRDLQDLGTSDEALEQLVDNGLLTRQNNRYLLRLGLWRDWHRDRPRPRGIIARLGRAIQRVLDRRWVRGMLLGALAAFLLVATVGTVYLLRTKTITDRTCARSALEVQITHPTYISYGDEQTLRVQISNPGGVDVVDPSVRVTFPDTRAHVPGTNGVGSPRLRPGEQRAETITFTSTQPGGWRPDTRSQIPVQVAISADGTACAPMQSTLAIAPLPHLQGIRQAAVGLGAAVLLPLLIEWWLLRRHRARIEAASDGKRVMTQRGAHGG